MITVGPVGLDTIVGRVLAEIGPLLTQRGIRLTRCVDAVHVHADDRLLMRILADLLRATAPGVAASLVSEVLDDRLVRLSIASPSALGIDLAATRASVESMGAALGTRQSDSENICWIDLRRIKSGESSSCAAAAVPIEGGSGLTCILHIEDNPSNRRLVATILRKESDLMLMSAADAAYGIELARRHRPALVLTDINIPGMDGYALLRELRKLPETSRVPIIAISADAMASDVERGLASGFSGYIRKPFKPADLVAAIRAVLG